MNAPTDLPAAARDDNPTALFHRQRAAFVTDRAPDLRVRRDRLSRLVQIVNQHERDFIAAVDEDFGHRSAHETRLAELYIVAAEARHAMRHLPRWMRPRRVRTPWHLLPASASIVSQARGVVGVISPWN
jgi:coniferyl-aldehyde dehydrogenase